MAAQIRHQHAIAEPGEERRVGRELRGGSGQTMAKNDRDAVRGAEIVVDQIDTVGSGEMPFAHRPISAKIQSRNICTLRGTRRAVLVMNQ